MWTLKLEPFTANGVSTTGKEQQKSRLSINIANVVHSTKKRGIVCWEYLLSQVSNIQGIMDMTFSPLNT